MNGTRGTWPIWARSGTRSWTRRRWRRALLAELLALRPAALTERYARVAPGMDGAELLCAVCESRSFFLPGRAPDTERAARIVLDEFRAGRAGPHYAGDAGGGGPCRSGMNGSGSALQPLPRATAPSGIRPAACWPAWTRWAAGHWPGRWSSAAPVMPPEPLVPYVNDSKKLTPKRREAVFRGLTQQARAWSLAFVGPEVVGRYQHPRGDAAGLSGGVRPPSACR